jgi:energy-coupling factor transporter ATP-binding protein EcfA2
MRMSPEAAILVLTGASGAGKTTLVAALRALGLPGVGCYFFDSVGVPSPEEMTRLYGGGEQWQSAVTEQWIERLMRNDDGVRVAVLDGQVRPSMVKEHLERLGVRSWRIVLADCGHAERNARLHGPRDQPELATRDMDCWAAYLRGQADALGLRVLDTARPIEVAVAELAALAEELARAVPAAGE